MKTVVWIVLIIVLSSLIVFVGCKNKGDIMDGPGMVNTDGADVKTPQDGGEGTEALNEPEKDPTEEPEKKEEATGLKIEDIKVGEGEAVKEGDTVKVHYTGMLTNGKVFDSSKERGEPFRFTVGAGNVIKGWEEGLIGMKVGGKRLLTIPPDLGYGDRDMGDIPPNSTLIFEIELLGLE